ncbi:MAG: hypothetical protein KDD62_11125, partial [Bdellovibrionales bacterium]|nr:hypothetical protein [Bdellovibrionales bacterium]
MTDFQNFEDTIREFSGPDFKLDVEQLRTLPAPARERLGMIAEKLSIKLEGTNLLDHLKVLGREILQRNKKYSPPPEIINM